MVLAYFMGFVYSVFSALGMIWFASFICWDVMWFWVSILAASASWPGFCCKVFWVVVLASCRDAMVSVIWGVSLIFLISWLVWVGWSVKVCVGFSSRLIALSSAWGVVAAVAIIAAIAAGGV